MNKDKALRQLRAILENSNFLLHPELLIEIIALIQGSGYENAFFNVLSARLVFLSNHRTSAHLMPQRNFEHLGQGIYSMHLQTSKFNIRILYALHGDQTILLHTFYERGGKSHTDYTDKVLLGLSRLRELEF